MRFVRTSILDLLFYVMLVLLTISCTPEDTRPLTDEEWHVGWRMFESYNQGEYLLAEKQFDSIYRVGLPRTFLLDGIKIKASLEKHKEANAILREGAKQYPIASFCSEYLVSDLEDCKDIRLIHPQFQDMSMKLIRMYVADQFYRGNKLDHIMEKYDIDESDMYEDNYVDIDLENMVILDSIINENGFPTIDQVGQTAMDGVFIIIQHAPDSGWQKEQLENILNNAANDGGLSMKDYAYLSDRIKVRNNQKQLYGTQIKQVDHINKELIFFDILDSIHLDERRKKFEMMPFEMYKRLIMQKIN